MSTSDGTQGALGGPESARDVLGRCTRLIVDSLPPGWSAISTPQVAVANPRVDMILRLTSPDGRQIDLVIEAKRAVERRDIASLSESLAQAAGALPNSVGVVAARYLAPPVREELAAKGLSYVDATGNLRLLASTPGLFLSARGPDADPWRGPGRPRGTLKGAPAAKVVRVLIDLPGTWTARELVAHSQASIGATYRVLDYLEREGLIDRSERGAVRVPSWRQLLDAWARDYDFFGAGRVSTHIAPRGLPWLMQRIADTDGVRYAVTGSLAVPAGARYAPARSAMVYVEDAAAAQEAWDLRPAESGQNVLLCEAPDSAAFQRATPTNDPVLAMAGLVDLARPAQVAVDLMGGPGRAPDEARALLKWMERDESTWRA